MKNIESKWTQSVNFHLLSGGSFFLFICSYLLAQSHKYLATGLLGIVDSLLFGALVLITLQRNIKFTYCENQLSLRRFPFLNAQSWSWTDILSIDLSDEHYDDFQNKTGEALYLRHRSGQCFLVAHRPGDRTELREIARDLRQRLL